MSISVVEPFESDLSTYRSALHFIPTADITEAAAHDGLQGLDKHDGYEWLVSTDPGARVGPGMTVSAWVQFHDTADGRAYFGFGAVPAGLNQNSGSGHTLSLVLAPNTHQFMFENNTRLDSFSSLGGVVSQDYDPGTWYRVEVVWGANGSLTGNLYDSTGVNLINTVHAATSAGAGGIAFRGFGSDKYFDTVVVDSDSTATPQEIVDAGGGLDPNWVPTDPPPPLQNGPSDGQTPIPWDYTSTPGTGRDIELQEFDQLTQVSGTGFIDDGTGTLWVVLAGQNVSHNVGSVGIDWGPSFGGAATPMLAQYIFRQRPGESTELLGVPADVKHFFAPDVLGPGQSDAYGSGLNWIQDLMTPGSELDPVTGRLQRASYSATMNADGVDVHHTMSYGALDHRLRVPVNDLDPSQNPPGTRWFLMGNIFVEGDQDVSNNSRWVEITPHLNASTQTFTFTYPNGSTGQLDFRTIPGLVAGPSVVSASPTGNVTGPVDTVTITFDSAIDPSTFTPAQVHIFSGPNGAIPVNDVEPVDNSDMVFAITFDAQMAAGGYRMTIGPDIYDFNGNPMVTSYTAQFSIVPAGNLLVNGDFETGSFFGWTQSGNTGATSVSTGNPHSGLYAADLGPVGSEGFLSQQVGTNPGASYTLIYWLSNDGGSPSQFEAYIDGAVIPGSQLVNPDSFGYTEYTFTFEAANPTTELQFGFRQDPAYFHLDDVSLSPSNVPGPSGRPNREATLASSIVSVATSVSPRMMVEATVSIVGIQPMNRGQSLTVPAKPVEMSEPLIHPTLIIPSRDPLDVSADSNGF